MPLHDTYQSAVLYGESQQVKGPVRSTKTSSAPTEPSSQGSPSFPLYVRTPACEQRKQIFAPTTSDLGWGGLTRSPTAGFPTSITITIGKSWSITEHKDHPCPTWTGSWLLSPLSTGPSMMVRLIRTRSCLSPWSCGMAHKGCYAHIWVQVCHCYKFRGLC